MLNKLSKILLFIIVFKINSGIFIVAIKLEESPIFRKGIKNKTRKASERFFK